MINSKVNQRALSRSLRKGIGIRVVGKGRGYIEAIRADGLMIFIDGDKPLDRIRTNAVDPRLVILAVAYRRAQQIACNYAAKHAPKLLADIKRLVNNNQPKFLELSHGQIRRSI